MDPKKGVEERVLNSCCTLQKEVSSFKQEHKTPTAVGQVRAMRSEQPNS